MERNSGRILIPPETASNSADSVPARAEASEVIADGVRVFTKRVHAFLFLFVSIMPADSNCVKPQDVGVRNGFR